VDHVFRSGIPHTGLHRAVASEFALTPMAIAALEQVLAWGVDRIQETVSRLASQDERGAIEMGATAVAERIGSVTSLESVCGPESARS
jgi:hypothetical protein